MPGTTPFQAVFNALPGIASLGGAVGVVDKSELPTDVGVTCSYSWDWGDGTVVTGTTPAAHTYSSPGTYVITLTITTSDSRTSTWTVSVSVRGRAKPRLAVSNLLRDLSPTTSATHEAGGVHQNAYNDQEWNWWIPGVSGDSYLTADFGSAVAASYFAFFAHNLQATGAQIQLQYSTDNVTWNDATGLLQPSGTQAAYVPFSTITARYWRVYLKNCSTTTMLGVVSFGMDFALEHGLYGDSFSPPGLAETATVTNNVSENGVFLGRIALQTASLLTITPKYMSESFAWGTWLPFLQAAEIHPVWFLWNPSEYPNIAAFGIQEGNMNPVAYDTQSFMTTSLQLRCKYQ